MKINCPFCSAGHEIDEATLSLTGGEIVCSQCGQVFAAAESGSHPTASQVPTAVETPEGVAGGPSVVGRLKGVTVLGATSSDQGQGDRFYIQRKSGKVFGPFDKALIRQMIEGGKLSGNEGVSQDKQVWIPILSVSDFAGLFRDRVAEGGPSTQPISSFAERPASGAFGSPEASGFSITGLLKDEAEAASANPFANTNLSDPNLFKPGDTVQEQPQGRLPSLKDIPMPDPVDFDLSDFPGLKTGTFGQPADSQNNQAGLPGSFSDSLPVPKKSAFGSADSVPELPRPKSGAGFTSNLPELPRPSAAQSSLPELPRPAGQSGLPELPRPKSDSGFSSPSALPELPRPANQSGLPELPTASRSGLPTPAYGGGVDSPTSAAGRLPQRKIDLDSLPLAGGPGGRTKQGLPTRRYDSELGAEFSSPMDFSGNPVAGSQADESLPLPNADFAASGFDLGFDQQVAPTEILSGPQIAAGMAGAASGAAEAAPSGPRLAASGPRDAAGPKAAPKSKPKDKKERTRKRTSQRSSKARMYVLGLIGIVGMGALGFALLSGGGNPADQEEVVSLTNRQSEPEVIVATEQVQFDHLFGGNFGDYAAFIEVARQAADTNQNRDLDSVARLVVGQALMAVQYGEGAPGTHDVVARVGFLIDSTEPLHALGRGAEFARQGNSAEALALLEPLQMGENAHWAHLFAGIAEMRSFERAQIDYANAEVPVVPVVPDEPGQEGASDEAVAPDEGETAEDGSEDEAEPADTDVAAQAEAEPVPEVPEIPDLPAVPVEPTLAPDALTAFETAARLEPRLAAARHFQGVYFELLGDREQALERYNQTVEAFPEHVPSQLAASRLLVHAGQFEEGANRLALLTDRPHADTTPTERSQIHYLTGRSALVRRRNEQAAEALEGALLEDANNDAALWDYVELQERAGNFDDALTFLADNVVRGDADAEYVLAKARLQVGKADSTAEPSSEVLRALFETVQNNRAQTPEDPRFPFFMGRIKQADGRFDLAETFYRETLTLDPDYRPALLQLAVLETLRGQPEMALAHLNDAGGRGADDASIETLLGLSFQDLNEKDQAALHFQRAIEIDPYALDARLAFARYLVERARPDDLTSAQEQLQWVEEVGVDEIDLHFAFAEVHYGLGDLDEARARMERVTEGLDEVTDPNHLYLIGRINFDLAELASTDARAQEAEERYRRAETSFATAFDAGRQLGDTRFWQGRSQLALGDYGGADRTLRRAIELSAQEGHREGRYYYWLGDALQKDGSPSQALDAYREVDRLDLRWAMDNPEIFFRRGRLYTWGMGRPRNALAERDFRWSLTLDPNRGDSAAALGRLYADASRYEAALELWDRALSINPDDALVYCDVGRVYNRLERYEEAAAAFERGLELGCGAQRRVAHRTLGFLYRELGRRPEAIAQLQMYLDATDYGDRHPVRIELENAIQRLRTGEE